MDGKQLDLVARGLTRESARRPLLGALFGVAFAALASSPVSAVNRRRRRGRNEDEPAGETIASLVPPGTLSGGIWDETLDICHFDPATGEYHIIPVSMPEVPGYLNAGDNLYIDCCVDTDCKLDQCLISTGCIEGACAFDVAYGASCLRNDGTTGFCDKEGFCGPTTTTITETGF
jgi:hypothetical protein